MSNQFTLHQVPFLHIYRDLSYSEFFDLYEPWRDGRVIAATHSFRHKDFDFWAKLKPNSTIYVSDRYEERAVEFARRFPWFEIWSVPGLHSKVIFFEKSGTLLVGSENLYAPTSNYAEVVIQTCVPEEDRQEVQSLLFGELRGTLLFCEYGMADLRIRAEDGLPFVPCNVEVDHWDLIANVISLGRPELHSPDRVYAVFEYNIGESKHFLAVDRSYIYCGDLDEEVVDWLRENCEVIQEVENYSGGHFPDYHPVPKSRCADKATWFGPVKDRAQHQGMMADVKRIEISDRKIRKKDSLWPE